MIDQSCYCTTPREDIKGDILSKAVPTDVLTTACCWKSICSVKEEYFWNIKDETWDKIVNMRQKALLNVNPFGD